MGSDSSQTSPTLLERLRQDPADQAAWVRFVDQYGPKIYCWCRKWRLQEADARDVTQEVLFKLVKKMGGFRYDSRGSFRGWLRRLTQNACSDFFDSRRRLDRGGEQAEWAALLDTVEARQDLTKHLEEAFDQEILEEAIRRVRQRVAGNTWEAFRLTPQEGRPVAEVAPQLGLTIARVYVARGDVRRLLTEEVGRLEGPGNDER